jgi:hypothetical protein
MDETHEIFDFTPKRRDYEPLRDGRWWIADFGSTDTPGLTRKIDQLPHNHWYSRIVAFRQWALRHQLIPQTVNVPVVPRQGGVSYIRVMVRAITEDQLWQEQMHSVHEGVDAQEIRVM